MKDEGKRGGCLWRFEINFVLQSEALRRKVTSMNLRSEAEENLRVIRSLMEKATIYRAISAPTALVGGLMSITAGLALYFTWRPLPRGIEEERFKLLFVGGWLAVLMVTGIANTYFIWSGARRRSEPFISPGMKLALGALFPPILCGAILSAMLLWIEAPFVLPPVWMLCYGLGLLSAKHFAPQSIGWLGWSFLVAGLVAITVLYILNMHARWGDGETHVPTAANLLMTTTFGLFHLIYAACTWPRKGAATTAA